MSGPSSILRAIRLAVSPPHQEAAPFLAVAAIGMLAGLVYHAAAVAIVGAAFALFCLYFFRDPERVAPDRPDVLLAPADGLVTEIAAAVPPPELGLGPAPMRRIATFLSVLDVHVNRAPASGIVRRVAYRPGRFLNASLDKASDENERNAIAIALGGGATIAVVQIAGLIARRIVCQVAEGDAVTAGGRFGLIRFGSRTDLYVPDGATILVSVGQTMIGGETVMATLDGANRPTATGFPEVAGASLAHDAAAAPTDPVAAAGLLG